MRAISSASATCASRHAFPSFFFFQAEDGIRDWSVTGVQTCALPISPITGVASEKQRADFEKDLLENLIPFVQANYRVAADRDHRALAGLSMGGGLTLAIGPRHLDTFSRLAVFSAGAGQNPQESLKDVAANAKNVNAQLKLFWMAIGDDDPGYLGA